MTATEFERIARELPELLNRQLRALTGRKLSDFTGEERIAYEQRKQEIQRLRAQLERFRKTR